MEKKTFELSEIEIGERIDKVVGNKFEEYSRSYIQKLIKDNHILVNGVFIKPNYRCTLNDMVEVDIPDLIELECKPEEIKLEIIYEDSDLIIINKPKGMVVHPAPGHYSGTIVNALLYYCKGSLSGINGVLRPGIVHRIDKDTTGAIIVCKNDNSHKDIAKQLKEHTVTRKYRAIVHGKFKEEVGIIDQPIGRHPTNRKKMSIHSKKTKKAITHYKVLETFPGYSYIECQLETGRTHQIRVHLSSIGHPLVGDEVYGIKEKKNFTTEGQVLHAMSLGFIHPTTKEYIEKNASLPTYFEDILNILRM